MSERTQRVSTTAVGVLAGVCAGGAERDLDQVATHTPTRTSLLLDYVFEDVLTTPELYYGGHEWVRFAAGVGEQPRSGIRAGDIETVLARHGLRLDSHLTADELTARYLRRVDGTTVARPYGLTAIAHAFVAA
jgi:O-methyltransferase involved in polyketide biosynthesis